MPRLPLRDGGLAPPVRSLPTTLPSPGTLQEPCSKTGFLIRLTTVPGTRGFQVSGWILGIWWEQVGPGEPSASTLPALLGIILTTE